MFTKTSTAIVDDAGCARVEMSPSGEKWHITEIAVKVDSEAGPIRESVAKIEVLGLAKIVGAPDGWFDGLHVESTSTGSSGDKCDTEFYVHADGQIVATWEGADIGATAVLTIVGSVIDSTGDGHAISE